MVRKICVMLIIVLSLPVCMAFDLSKISDDELFMLYGEVQVEMAKRGLPDTVWLPVGTYTLGNDIPYGLYLASSSISGEHSACKIFDDSGEIVWDGYVSDFEEVGLKIDLSNDGTIKILGSPMKLLLWQ